MAIIGICALPVAAHQRTINWPVKALLAFTIISIFLIPPVILQLGHFDLGGSWCWKSLAWVMAYFMLYQRLAGFPLLEGYREKIALAIGWAAFLSACYAIVQSLNIDQFQVMRTYKEMGNKTAGEITAMIGSPVYLAVFLCLCLPFCINYMKWWQTSLVCIAILACQSDTGTIGAVFIIVLMAAMRAKSTIWLKVMVCGGILCGALILSFWPQVGPKIESMGNGRFLIWQQVWEDYNSPAILLPITEDMPENKRFEAELLNKRKQTITGRGPGSFEFFFTRKHEAVSQYGVPILWNDPHNVYLRVLYELGAVGLGLFLGVIGFVLWKAFPAARADQWSLTLFCSFAFWCFAGLTTPLLIVEPLRFYAVAIFALLSKTLIKDSLQNRV